MRNFNQKVRKRPFGRPRQDKIILQQIVKKRDVKVWPELFWLRTGFSGAL